MDTINVILVDDHVIVRNGIKALLGGESGVKVIGEASNGEEALSVAKELQPDIVIIDIKMPVMNGIEATRLLKQQNIVSKVIILSMHDSEEYVIQAVESGADGYLLKDTSKDSFIKAIRKVNDGEKYYSGAISQVLVNNYLNKLSPEASSTPPTVAPKPQFNEFNLTKRELEILQLISSGFANKDIAEELGKSVRTIETHRFNIMKKLKVHNAIEMLNVVEKYKLLA